MRMGVRTMKHVKTIALATGATLAATAAAAATYTLPAPGARQNALVSQAVPPAAAAAQAPATTTQAPGEVTITARDQPIAAFLRDLFGRVGRPVVPSPSLTGTVNGLFRGSVNKIYGDVAKAFNLVSYDDGAALYVYGANELRVVTLQVGPAAAQRASRLAAAQRLTDRRNYIRTAADGALVVSGTPRFIEQVTALARDGGDAVAGAPGRLPSYGAPLNVAPAVQPLEFRVFYLRYARAEDTVTVAGGREQRLPASRRSFRTSCSTSGRAAARHRARRSDPGRCARASRASRAPDSTRSCRGSSRRRATVSPPPVCTPAKRWASAAAGAAISLRR